MSAGGTTTPPGGTAAGGTARHVESGPDRAQYGLAAVLAVIGVWTVADSAGLGPGFADQVVRPGAFGYVIGSALVLLAVLLAVATARG